MSESKDTQHNVDVAGILGKKLQAEREKQGLDVETVAGRLKLTAEQIKALESGDYRSLPNIVYVSGFLRTYVRLLGLDDEETQQCLKHLIPQSKDHVYVVNREDSSALAYQSIEKTGFPKWILGVAALILIGGGVFAWQDKSNQENQLQNEQDSQAVQNSLQAPALSSSNVAVSKMTDEGKQEIADASASAASNVAASAASEPQVQVAADELWIKVQYRSNLIIKDKDGKMIFSRIVPAGSERRFQGGAPYDVWVGIAAGAQANYGGTAINPAEHREQGKKSALFIAGKK